MNTTILDILDEYGLNKVNTLSKRLDQFSMSDWSNFADSLENFLESQPPIEQNVNSITPLSFYFPSLPTHNLEDISPHLLIADKVYLDDPLSACVFHCAAGGFVGVNDIKKQTDAFDKTYSEYTNRVLREKIKKTIVFYWKAKDLIKEGRFVPYGSMDIPDDFVDKIAPDIGKFMFHDKEYKRIAGQKSLGLVRISFYLELLKLSPKIIKVKFNQIFRDTGNRREEMEDIIGEISNYLNSVYGQILGENYIEAFTLFMSMFLQSLSTGRYGLSTDFISPSYAHMYRKVIEIVDRANKQLPLPEQLSIPSNFSINYLQVPTLTNISINRVLDVISEEPDAFVNFRSSLNEKFLKITAHTDDPDREQQILEISQSLKKGCNEIDSTYKEIKKSFAGKLEVELLIGTASIFVAGLSTIGKNLDVLSLTTGVLAASGLAGSLKDFARDCLEYQREIRKLKKSENYFIWRLYSKKVSSQ